MPAATRTTRMLQASTAHADFKHACTCVPFLPRGIQRPNAAGPDAQNGPVGRKGLKLAAPRASRSNTRTRSVITAAPTAPCTPRPLPPPVLLLPPEPPPELLPPGTAGGPAGAGADIGAPPPLAPANGADIEDTPASGAA